MCSIAAVMNLQRIAIHAVLLGLAACGPSDNDGHDDATAVLSLDPPQSELLIANGVPATEGFTATLTYADGESRDVTNEVRFSIDTGYGMFAGPELTMTAAGKTNVYATWGADKRAMGEVIARLKTVRVDPSVNPQATDWFTNLTDDPSRAPEVVYLEAIDVIQCNHDDL